MSKHELYDIGSKILYEPPFDHNSTQKSTFFNNKYRRDQLDEIYISASEPNLNHCGALFGKRACDLGFTSTLFFGCLPSEAYKVDLLLSKSKVPKM